MKAKLLHEENGLKTFAFVFDKDDDVKGPLLEFANKNALSAAQVTAIGAFSEVTLGYFDRPTKSY
jgi:predicted DNA-binding protein with PD1-like motif